MKTVYFVLFFVVVIAWVLVFMFGTQPEQPVEIELAQFMGILYDATYHSASDCFILVFTDGRVLKVDKQPSEGWVLAGIYEITIYARGVKIELIGSMGLNEKFKKDKTNPNPGKAF